MPLKRCPYLFQNENQGVNAKTRKDAEKSKGLYAHREKVIIEQLPVKHCMEDMATSISSILSPRTRWVYPASSRNLNGSPLHIFAGPTDKNTGADEHHTHDNAIVQLLLNLTWPSVPTLLKSLLNQTNGACIKISLRTVFGVLSQTTKDGEIELLCPLIHRRGKPVCCSTQFTEQCPDHSITGTRTECGTVVWQAGSVQEGKLVMVSHWSRSPDCGWGTAGTSPLSPESAAAYLVRSPPRPCPCCVRTPAGVATASPAGSGPLRHRLSSVVSDETGVRRCDAPRGSCASGATGRCHAACAAELEALQPRLLA
uniref:Uncharacterized protein n=1 Tax=Timema tahoe TaxID=61484 RepID=A0A7R9IJS0_9NEOP|nr:unnamed protein product [Timema tahoe]